MEKWKDVIGYEGLYEVSNIGNVRSKGNGNSTNPNHCVAKPITLRLKGAGYHQVKLFKNGTRRYYMVHRLVGFAFMPNPKGKTQINHKDGNKINNCVSNLEWATPSENVKHSFDTGLNAKLKGKDNPQSISILQLDLSGNVIKEWGSIKQVLREKGFNTIGIIKCCKKEKRYKTAYGYKWEYKHLYAQAQ
jgi:hypothetical protein